MGNTIESSMNSCIFLPPILSEWNFKNFKNLSSNQKLLYCTSANGNKIAFYRITSDFNDYPNNWVIWSHGNAETIYDSLDYLTRLCNQINVGIIVYDYQGYGLSEGSPSEQNCYDDITAIVNYVKNEMKINPDQITLIGRSLGTGVVVDYAWKNKWKRPIILISPYKSMTSVVSNSLAFSFRPLDKFVTIDKISKLKCPVKIYHGDKDTVIDISHSKELWELVQVKTFEPIWFSNIGHNNIVENINTIELMSIIYS